MSPSRSNRLSSLPRSLTVLLGALALAWFSSCTLNPVQNNAEKALGDENPDVPPGPLHRPGQPCVTCHSEAGSASDSPFVLAGTVFYGPDRLQGVPGAYVSIKDASSNEQCYVTNCAGNFFVRPEQFSKLTFPLLVATHKGNRTRAMGGHIGREPTCGGCHKNQVEGSRFFNSPGQVRIYDTEAEVDALGPLPQCNPDTLETVCPPPAEK